MIEKGWCVEISSPGEELGACKRSRVSPFSRGLSEGFQPNRRRLNEFRSGTTPKVFKATSCQTCCGVFNLETKYSKKNTSPTPKKSPKKADSTRAKGISGEKGREDFSACWLICMLETARSLETVVSLRRLRTFS